jgi:hypothetical protein
MRFQLKNVGSITHIWNVILTTLKKMKIVYQESRENGIIYFQSFYREKYISMSMSIIECHKQNFLVQFHRKFGDQLSAYSLYYDIVNQTMLLPQRLQIPHILRKGTGHDCGDEDIENDNARKLYMESIVKWDLRFMEDMRTWSSHLCHLTKCQKFVENYVLVFNKIMEQLTKISDQALTKGNPLIYKTIFGCLVLSLKNMINGGYSDRKKIEEYRLLLDKVIERTTSDEVMKIVCMDSLNEISVTVSVH